MVLIPVALIVLSAFAGTQGRPYHDPHCQSGHDAIVHLFDWKWTSVKKECVEFLGPKGFCAVQVSPPAEHAIITNPNRPWWERYQPVSYKIITRSGNEQEFRDMVATCNTVGVRIYVDAVINHMTGGIVGVGTGGDPYDGNNCSFPGVPYTMEDCNGPDKCNTSDGDIHDYDDPVEARNCDLFGLRDLRLSKEYVRQHIAGYMNKLVDMGVAGFRIDAAKHMWPGDLANVFGRLHDLPTPTFKPGSRPFIYQEVIDQPNARIKIGDYLNTGRVTNFDVGVELANIFLHHQILTKSLKDFQTEPGKPTSDDALVFIYNHDTERDSMRPLQPITFRNPNQMKLATAFMLAHPYGFPRIMSSFNWTRNLTSSGEDKNSWTGPPHNADMSIKDLRVLADGMCADGWVCEHRWPAVYHMLGFRLAVEGTPVLNWQDTGDYQFAFSRGTKGFIAFVGDNSVLDHTFQTGLPGGSYCDVISGELDGHGTCTGKTVTVDNNGHAHIIISGTAQEPLVAIHINAKL